MPFTSQVATEILVLCARRCCICRRFCGKKMQLHHIIPEAAGGDDSADNCIPLCLECHEEVGSYNPAHPIGRKFTGEELKRHRDLWFEFVKAHPERLAYSVDSLLRSNLVVAPATAEILAVVEPHYHEATIWSKEKGSIVQEVFAAKVRNQGARSIYVDVIGFTAGEVRYPGLFSPYSSKSHDEASEILPGRSQIFSFFGVKLEESDLPKLDGMYLITGTGHEFISKNVKLDRLVDDLRKDTT